MREAASWSLRAGIIHREWEEEHYFLTPDGKFHSVTDPVGALVLSMLARGPQTLTAILRAASRRFEGPAPEEMSAELLDFLQTLQQRGIVESRPHHRGEPAPRRVLRTQGRST